jgi:hypothetical protein
MTSKETLSAYRSRLAGFDPPGEPGVQYRSLTTTERAELEAQGNSADDWNCVLVAKDFSPQPVARCRFAGRVKLGVFEELVLSAGETSLPVGLYDSTIIASTVAGNSAVHHTGIISHSYIAREALLFRVNQLSCAAEPSFGLGFFCGSSANRRGCELRDSRPLEPVNENGSRPVLLHPEVTSADCFLQIEAVGDAPLQERLEEMTGGTVDALEEQAGEGSEAAAAHPVSTVGEGAAILSAGLLRSVRIGPAARLNAPALLEDVTVRSSAEHPAVIGTGVQLIRGLAGYGSRILSGAIAEDFFIADAAALDLGGRLLHSVLGENSALSCAEVQHALLGPFHAQHHNNSFLIAARLEGQSNIAAGATLGSNHNSRAADGEIIAGRGFWPALSCSIKHNCRFASYTLLAKASYPAELFIPLPFSLVSRDDSAGRLQIMPGYWFMYNMYALARNALKFAERDRRPEGGLFIEHDFLAPDTAEELLQGTRLLESWLGRERLEAGEEELLLPEAAVERSRRQPVILKAASGYRWYRRILHLYGIQALHAWRSAEGRQLSALPRGRIAAAEQPWRNLGGLLLPEEEWRRLRADILSGELPDWNAVHLRYDELSEHYPELKAAHGWSVLSKLHHIDAAGAANTWPQWYREAAETVRQLAAAAEESRRKDYRDAFRQITFRSTAEADAVYHPPEEDRFLSRYRRRCEELASALEACAEGKTE